MGRPEIDCEACEARSAEFDKEPPCEDCPLPKLTEEDRQAWDLYGKINNQFVYDFHALPLIFEIEDLRLSRSRARELLEKLAIIHEMVTKKAHSS